MLPGAKPGKHPGFVQPQLATLKDKVPTRAGFIHEIKFDGYRLQAHKRSGFGFRRARLVSPANERGQDLRNRQRRVAPLNRQVDLTGHAAS